MTSEGSPANTGAVLLWATVRVFVSSTWIDLQAEREAVEKVLHRFADAKFVGMEYFGSRNETTLDASLEAVDRCQLYVGIIGRRYGSGITEWEYRRARERGLDCLIYVHSSLVERSEAAESQPDALDLFVRALRGAHTVTPFRGPEDLAASIAADVHNWISHCWVRRGFLEKAVAGIDALPNDYAGRIQNFLVEYLGTERRPVPFGGRNEDLATLDRWLARGDGAPYALLAAPAGRGKSALVAHWSRLLTVRPNVISVFLPVSIRFRTNLASVVFASLAARLARIYEEELRSPGEGTVEVWRGLVNSYLRRVPPGGKTLVLVLDGLDEAADWEAAADLFPREPPAGIRILVTARYRAGDTDGRTWLQALGWDEGIAESIDLQPLSKSGVRDVLMQMSAPLDEVGAKLDIVEELYRLSEGDPLLVRFYVEDLWTRGEAVLALRPEDLRSIRPGLSGYFQRWWKEQQSLWGKEAPLREAAVQCVLNLMACALGPLPTEDLLRLAPEDSRLSTWTLLDALQPLGRFIIGDGHTQGFVFSHPRLGIYFYDLLTPPERRKWESRFLAWGRQTLAGLGAGGGEVPGYLIQYYGAHLERCTADCRELLALVDDGWRRAWVSHEGAYTGFLNDVERAWRAVERADEERIHRGQPAMYIGEAIECALCAASVNTLTTTLPPSLLRALVAHHVWTVAQGFAFLRQIREPQRKSEAFAALAPLLPAGLLDQAIEAAGDPVPPELLGRLAEVGRVRQALAILRERPRTDPDGLPDPLWMGASLQAVAGSVTPETVEEAIAIAQSMDTPHRAEVLLPLSLACSPPRRLELLQAELARAAGQAAVEGIDRVGAAAGPDAVAYVMTELENPENRWRCTYPADPADALLVRLAFARHLPALRAGIIELVEKEHIHDHTSSGQIGALLAALLPHPDPARHEALLNSLVSGSVSPSIVRRIRPFLRPEHIPRLLGLGTEVAADRLWIVPEIAPLVSEPVWEQVAAMLLDDPNPKALAAIFPCLSPPRRLDLCTGFEAQDDDAVAWALWAVAPSLTLDSLESLFGWHLGLVVRSHLPAATAVCTRLAELGDWHRALELATAVPDAAARQQLLLAIARGMRDPAGQRELLARAPQAIAPAEILESLASRLDPNLLPQALAVAQRIGDEDAQRKAALVLLLLFVKDGALELAEKMLARIGANPASEVLEEYATALARHGYAEAAVRVLIRLENPSQHILRQVISYPGGVAAVVRGAPELARTRATVLLESWPRAEFAAALPFVSELAEETRAWAVELLAPQIPGDLVPSLTGLARGIPNETLRGRSLAAILPRLEGPSRDALLAQVEASSPSGWPGGDPVVLRSLHNLPGSETVPVTLHRLAVGSPSSWEVRLGLTQIAGQLDDTTWPLAWALAMDRCTEDEVRARACAFLCRSAPEPVRRAKAEQTFALVGTLMRARERWEAILDLAPVLDEPSRPRAFRDALWREAVRSADRDEWLPAESLAQVLAVAPVSLFRDPEVWSILGKHAAGPKGQAALTAGLRGRRDLPAPVARLLDLPVERPTPVPDIASGPAQSSRPVTGDDSWQLAEGLVRAAADVASPGDALRLVRMAISIAEPGPRAYAIAGMIDLKDPEAKAEAEGEALRLAAQGLLGTRPTVLWRGIGSGRPEWLAAARYALQAEMDRIPARRDPLNVPWLARLAAELPLPESYGIWKQILHALARDKRAALLEEMSSLGPWIRKLGGPAATERTAAAIDRVLVWWP